jgi:hypothetical protein
MPHRNPLLVVSIVIVAAYGLAHVEGKLRYNGSG